MLFFVFVSRNLRKTESRKNKLEDLLNSVGARVNELKEKYGLVFLLHAFHAACSAASVVLLVCYVFWFFFVVLVFSEDGAQIVVRNALGRSAICICSPQERDAEKKKSQFRKTTWLLLH